MKKYVDLIKKFVKENMDITLFATTHAVYLSIIMLLLMRNSVMTAQYDKAVWELSRLILRREFALLRLKER